MHKPTSTNASDKITHTNGTGRKLYATFNFFTFVIYFTRIEPWEGDAKIKALSSTYDEY